MVVKDGQMLIECRYVKLS